MSFKAKVIVFSRRKKMLTSRNVADRFGIPIQYAGALTCTLANEKVLIKKRKIRQPGKRWFWLFEIRG